MHHKSLFHAAGIVWIAALCTGGCSCSTQPAGTLLPPDSTTSSAGQVPPLPAGVRVPPTIITRQWHADSEATTGSDVPNDFGIRVYGEDEILCVAKTRSPFVKNAENREVCMMAFTCSKPGCASQGKAGRPVLFTRDPQEYYVGSGRVMQPSLADLEAAETKIVWGPPNCPVCGSNQNTKPYVLPEVQPRLARLEDELRWSREQLKAARAAGHDLSPGARPPTVIFDEISRLPQLYLVRQTPPAPGTK